MDILEENKNPEINECTGKPEKMCVDWPCTNPECNFFDIFVDGGSLFPPGKVRFNCGYCGKTEEKTINQ